MQFNNSLRKIKNNMATPHLKKSMSGSPLRLGFFLAALVPLLASAQPVVLGVLNAASYHAAVAPGSLVSIFGANSFSARYAVVMVPGTATFMLLSSSSQGW